MEPVACSHCSAVERPALAAGDLVLCRTCTDRYLGTPSGMLVYSALVKGAALWVHQQRLAAANAVPGPTRLQLEVPARGLVVLPGGKS